MLSRLWRFSIINQAGKLAKVVLVTDKKTTPVLFKALSIEYLDRLIFGEIKSSNKELVESLKVEKYPAVLLFPKEDNAEPIFYDGPIKQEAVVGFLDKYAIPPVKSKKDKKTPKSKAEKNTKKAKCIDH